LKTLKYLLTLDSSLPTVFPSLFDSIIFVIDLHFYKTNAKFCGLSARTHCYFILLFLN
jgi:hypothetical protein